MAPATQTPTPCLRNYKPIYPYDVEHGEAMRIVVVSLSATSHFLITGDHGRVAGFGRQCYSGAGKLAYAVPAAVKRVSLAICHYCRLASHGVTNTN